MADEFETLIGEDVLGGLFDRHARVASTVLFAIQNRTAHLAAQSKQATERFLTEEMVQERELAFLEALALGRAPPIPPTIQDLERYAQQWSSLVPKNPSVQATVAHHLSQNYHFTKQDVPGIRSALGLDTEAVEQAYQRLYHAPLKAIFATQTTPADRLRWAKATLATYLETLPPFWIVFSLTLTETVGAGILALPIALADIGPLAGVVILFILGLINMLTVACMAEAVARSGVIRYGNAFLGQMVTDYLGRAGSLILSLGLTTMCVLTLWPLYIGFSTTLADATQIPASIWCALIFIIGLYFLRRETLNVTIASALVIGVINIGLILILSLLAIANQQFTYLLYTNVPFVNGRPFNPSILQLIFGVILLSYFGHLSVSNCARTVLYRDPSARSLIWGSVAAQGAVMLIYCIWVLAINGTIRPQILASQSGTALAPLAAEIGPIVHILGSLFVILGMGIGTIHSSLPLYNLVRERLPTMRKLVILLPCRRGRLLLRKNHPKISGINGHLLISLTYLGFEFRGDNQAGQLRFCLDIQAEGTSQRLELPICGHWESAALFDQVPALRQQGMYLMLEVLDASQEYVRLRVSSPLHLAYEGQWYLAGLSMADVFDLPGPQQELVSWLVREEMIGQDAVSLAEIANHFGESETLTHLMLDGLVEQGFIQDLSVDGKTCYRPRLVSRKGRQLPDDIWQSLSREQQLPGREGLETGGIWQRLKQVLLGKEGRYVLSVAPVTVIFLLTEWLLMTEAGSFTGPLSFLGVIVISLLGGTFPVLLLIASRQKGEVVPGVVYRFLGHPVVVIGIYLLYLASLFLHGLIIWDNPLHRAAAMLVGGLILVVTVVLACRGTFAPRLVVELRHDQRGPGQSVFAVTVGGQPAITQVRLGYPDGEQEIEATAGEIPAFSSLSNIAFRLPATRARELKVWAYRITSQGDSESLSALLQVQLGSEQKEFDLKLSAGQKVLPFNGRACQVMINSTVVFWNHKAKPVVA